MGKNDLKRDKRFRKHLAQEFQVEQPPESYLKAVRSTLDSLPDELPVKRRPFYQSALRACAAFAVCLLVAVVGAYGAYLANPVFMENLPGVGQIFQELNREERESPKPSPTPPRDAESHVEQEALPDVPSFEPVYFDGNEGLLVVENAWCDGIYLHLDLSLEAWRQDISSNSQLSTCIDPYDSSTNTLVVSVNNEAELETSMEPSFFTLDSDKGTYTTSLIFRMPEERGHGDNLYVTVEMPTLNYYSVYGEETQWDCNFFGEFSVTVDTSDSLIQDTQVEDNGVTLERVEATPTFIMAQVTVPYFGTAASTLMVPYSYMSEDNSTPLGYYEQLTTPDGQALPQTSYSFADTSDVDRNLMEDGYYHLTYCFQAAPEGVQQVILTLYEYPPTGLNSSGENTQSNRVTAEFTIDLGQKRVYPSQNYLLSGRKKLDYRISASLDRTPDPENGYICSVELRGEFLELCFYTTHSGYQPVELRRYEEGELAASYYSVSEEEYNSYAEGHSVYQDERYAFVQQSLSLPDTQQSFNALCFQLYDLDEKYISNPDFPLASFDSCRFELVDSVTGEVLVSNVVATFLRQYDQVFGTQMEDTFYGNDSNGEVSYSDRTAEEISTVSPQPF